MGDIIGVTRPTTGNDLEGFKKDLTPHRSARASEGDTLPATFDNTRLYQLQHVAANSLARVSYMRGDAAFCHFSIPAQGKPYQPADMLHAKSALRPLKTQYELLKVFQITIAHEPPFSEAANMSLIYLA